MKLLDILIPAAVIAYAAWTILHWRKMNRCTGDCASCKRRCGK